MELSFTHSSAESANVWSFYFDRPRGLVFEAGDYLDVEIAYQNSELGGRRWLTISSSPHQPHIRFTVKLPPQPSQFKRALMNLQPGHTVQVSPPIGTFHLPRLSSQPVLWVAGGIGATPYLSMAQWLEHKHQSRDITCLYFAKTGEHIFSEPLGRVAEVTELSEQVDHIGKLIPDYSQRHIYISGPQDFCLLYYNQLLLEGMPRSHLHLDYFPGYTEL